MRFLRAQIAQVALCLVAALYSSAQKQSVTQIGNVTELLQRGQDLVSLNRLAEAEVIYAEAAKLSPNDSPILTSLAKVKSRLGEFSQASDLFRKVVLAHPTSSEAHLNLAIALADLSRSAEALHELQIVLRLDPQNADAHLNRARLLADAQRIVEAREEFRRAEHLAPDNANIDYFWAILEKEDHKPEAAAALLSKVVVRQPNNARAFYFLGQEEQALNRTKEAVLAWKKAVLLDPDLAEAFYALAQSLRDSDPEESTRSMRRFETFHAARQNAERAGELGNQAYAAMQQQQWDSAVGILTQAIEICATCSLQADLHQRLGLAECHQGRLDICEFELRKALTLDPNNRETLQAIQWVGDHRK